MRTSSQLCVKLSRSVSAGLCVDQKAHDRIQIPHEKTFTGTAKNPDHVAYLVSIKPSKKKSHCGTGNIGWQLISFSF